LDLKSFYKIFFFSEQADVNEEIIQELVDNVWEFLQSKVTSIQSQSTVTSSATALMRQYLNIPHQDLKSNIFTFWNQHKSVLYPLGMQLFQQHQYHLTEFFSKDGQILFARRNRLLPDNLDTLIFLSKNM